MRKQAKELLKKNNQREKALTKENSEVLTDMVVYLRGSDLTDYNQELVRADLIEMVLDAQLRGEDCEQVFGENYQSICDEIIGAFPRKTKKEKLLDGIGTMISCIWIVVGIQGLKWISSMLLADHGPMMPVSVGDLINLVLICVGACAIFQYFTKHTFDKQGGQKKSSKLEFFVLWIGFMIYFCALLAISYYLCQPVFTIHVAVMFAVSVAVFLLNKGFVLLTER